VAEEITYSWREAVADDELISLVESHGGTSSAGWCSRVSASSLGWVSARNQDGLLVGLSTSLVTEGVTGSWWTPRPAASHQHRGIGRELLWQAAENAKAPAASGFTSIFEPHLARFYADACGFQRTDAGLIHLPTSRTTG